MIPPISTFIIAGWDILSAKAAEVERGTFATDEVKDLAKTIPLRCAISSEISGNVLVWKPKYHVYIVHQAHGLALWVSIVETRRDKPRKNSTRILASSADFTFFCQVARLWLTVVGLVRRQDDCINAWNQFTSQKRLMTLKLRFMHPSKLAVFSLFYWRYSGFCASFTMQRYAENTIKEKEWSHHG